MDTNKAIPGLLAPPGMGLLTAGAVATTMGAPTMMQAAVQQTANFLARPAASYTGASLPSVNWGGAMRASGVNLSAVAAAFEAGVYVGSMISEAMSPSEQGSDGGCCGCQNGS